MKFNFFEKILRKKPEESEESLPVPEGEIQKEKQKKLIDIDSEETKEERREENLSKTPEEKILETREKEKTKPLNGGWNETILVIFRGNVSGIFKPKNGESQLRIEVKPGTYYKRERAAYLVDKFLGFDLVPPTVIREIDGEIGSIQQFLGEDEKTWMWSQTDYREKIENEQLIKLWIFDYVIWSSDRHSSNFLVKDNKIYAIDNGLSFGKDDLKCYKEFFNTSIPQDIIEKFEKFFSWDEGKKILRDLLNELLDKKEVDACLKRIERIGKLISQNGTISLSAKDELTFE